MIDQSKRNSLKNIAGAAVSAATVGISPLLFADEASAAGQAAISITHVETVFGRTVFIENLSNKTVVLKSLRPGRISSASGDFDLNSLLTNDSLEVQAASTQAHNISNDGRVHNWAIWQTTQTTQESMVTDGRVRPVNVYLHDSSLVSAPVNARHHGYFA